jgi:hypothetical protein
MGAFLEERLFEERHDIGGGGDCVNGLFAGYFPIGVKRGSNNGKYRWPATLFLSIQ